jgi:hypothetical protein
MIYRDDLGQCTLCTIREAIARGGEHTNVAVPAVSEIEGALFGMTYAAMAIVENTEAVEDMDSRYRLTTGPEQLAIEQREAIKAKARRNHAKWLRRRK